VRIWVAVLGSWFLKKPESSEWKQVVVLIYWNITENAPRTRVKVQGWSGLLN
jgi:hypothetical protein